MSVRATFPYKSHHLTVTFASLYYKQTPTTGKMKVLALATVIVSALSQLSAAQSSSYSVSCERSVFGGIPTKSEQRQAANNVCLNGLDCKKVQDLYVLTPSDFFQFSCASCPAGLAEEVIDGCKISPL
ncbi:hypothetical protein BUE80_DR012059 [Diplocarpon rosae]|nr:hypothetical protein BUE80_DR012059 [Diplocarpon rosae]